MCLSGLPTPVFLGFPCGSAGKESTCSADLGSISGLGRSPGEGKGYPLQYSWASLVAQLVKNPPAMQEIWVRSLGWEDPLEKGKATHSSILAWRIPWTAQSMASQRVGHDWAIFTCTFLFCIGQAPLWFDFYFSFFLNLRAFPVWPILPGPYPTSEISLKPLFPPGKSFLYHLTPLLLDLLNHFSSHFYLSPCPELYYTFSLN